MCSISPVEELTLRQARELLANWAAEHAALTARRDVVIRTALAAGVSKTEVHRVTGVARTTIDRVIAAGSSR